MTPEDFNTKAMIAGTFTVEHITQLVKYYQRGNGLEVDGKCGPATRDHLDAATPAVIDPSEVLTIDEGGWLVGPHVKKWPAHVSWYGPLMPTSTREPKAIVAHYTATNPGTGPAMARHRETPYQLGDRMASWHVTVDEDTIYQMVPFQHMAFHAGSPTSKPIPGLMAGNKCAVGIELCGHGEVWPEPQVKLAGMVWRALVKRYRIDKKYAMVEHRVLDPTRRNDPGPVWMRDHAPAILRSCYPNT